jgi:WD40 repeat protein
MPVTTIKAHDTKIYGIDWSRRSDDGIVTCGLDKTVKVSSPTSVLMDLPSFPYTCECPFKLTLTLPSFPCSPVQYWSTKTPDTPRITIQTNSPVWRARHLPFGKGVLTLPQRSETTLRVWARGPPAREIGKFEGHTDVVKEFVWRVRGGLDDSNGEFSPFGSFCHVSNADSRY